MTKISAAMGRAAICAGLVVGLTFGAASAAVAATVYTTWKTWTVSGTTYQTRAYLTDAAVYGTSVQRSDGATSPAGYLGATAGLWLGTTHCGTAGPIYSATSKVAQVVYGDSRIGNPGCLGAGNYTAKGLGYAYNPATGGYLTKGTLNTPIKYLPSV